MIRKTFLLLNEKLSNMNLAIPSHFITMNTANDQYMTPLIDSILNSQNIFIQVMGQSGAGKSYSILILAKILIAMKKVVSYRILEQFSILKESNEIKHSCIKDLCTQDKVLFVHQLSRQTILTRLEFFYSKRKMSANQHNKESSISTVALFLELEDGQNISLLDIRGQEQNSKVDNYYKQTAQTFGQYNYRARSPHEYLKQKINLHHKEQQQKSSHKNLEEIVLLVGPRNCDDQNVLNRFKQELGIIQDKKNKTQMNTGVSLMPYQLIEKKNQKVQNKNSMPPQKKISPLDNKKRIRSSSQETSEQQQTISDSQTLSLETEKKLKKKYQKQQAKNQEKLKNSCGLFELLMEDSLGQLFLNSLKVTPQMFYEFYDTNNNLQMITRNQRKRMKK